MQTEVGGTTDKVEELETTLTGKWRIRKQHKRSLVTLTESVQALQTTSSNMQTEVGGTTEKVEELETTLTREMENTKANKRSLEILTETVQALQTTSSNMQTEVGGTTDKVEELETTLTREMENTKANKRSLVTLTESVQALQTTSSNVMILNGEESAGNARCAKVCAGTTGRSSTSHSRYGSQDISIYVNISGCGFVKIPTITTSVEGRGGHDEATGTSSVYSATRTGFTMRFRRGHASHYATIYNWNVEWIAIGYTC
ncbi:uncharacterized protein LOC134817663 [Bolinopsis microptera]|uniref:uncharacterized protein LOC134817663 n=1 Tax=Bolinopsis microptera TaxID=2820187 RepID=UPI00307AA23C